LCDVCGLEVSSSELIKSSSSPREPGFWLWELEPDGLAVSRSAGAESRGSDGPVYPGPVRKRAWSQA